MLAVVGELVIMFVRRHFPAPVSMRLLRILLVATLLAGLNAGLLASQRGFGSFEEEDEAHLPINGDAKAEWVFARFHYPSGAADFGFRGFRRWAADYPKSDRQFILGVHRLTRLDTQAVEQVVNPDSDDVYNWPWIFVEDAGQWRLSTEQAARMREYLLRGGFLLLDDTHGDYEWENMLAGLRMMLPDLEIEDLADEDEIFHVLYDVEEKLQIPGTRFIWGGRPYLPDMRVPRWSAIRDDHGRIIVAICHNVDVGDAWEWADSPHYPEAATALSYRLGVNYIIYSLTH